MTPRQMTMYRAEWAKLAQRLKAAGRNPTDELRKELHILALGYEMSSKSFNNYELDKVLYLFRTQLNHVGEWRAILAREHAPKIRLLHCAHQLLLQAMPHMTSEESRRKYLEGTARRMFTASLQMLTQEQLGKLCAAMNYHRMRQERKRAQQGIHLPPPQPALAPAGTHPDDDETPFGW